MTSPIITVIVPIYNVDKYLEGCLISILKQTYTNLEIILINDGSTDASPRICDSYASLDNRIRVVHQENQGVSSARNLGIDISRGQYITFIDADDYIDPDYLNNMITIIEQSKCEIVVSQLIKFDNTNADFSSLSKKICYKIDSGIESCAKLLYQKEIHNGIVSKIFTKKAIGKCRFSNEIAFAEDLELNFKLLINSSTVSITGFQGYCYCKRPNSAINSKFKPRRMDGIKVTSRILANVANNHKKLIRAAENRHFMEAIYIYGSILNSKHKLLKERNVCSNIIKLYRRNVIMDSNSRLQYRLLALSSYFGVSIPVMLTNLYTLTKRFLS